MEQRPLPPAGNRPFQPSQPNGYNQPLRLPVQKPPHHDFERTFPLPAQKAYFPQDSVLILSIESATEQVTPLMIQLAPMTVIGRVENGKREKTVIDLSPYAARGKGVSRLHALLHRSLTRLQIEDMNSRNGTYINGRRLDPHQRQTLHDGDELRLGALVMHIQFQ